MLKSAASAPVSVTPLIRFKAVVPVCSVGNYQAYLKAACCVCEVLPGALRFTEEGDVLVEVDPAPFEAAFC